jgi:arabinofuranan 3-O-arabinosyltransferase
VLVVPESINPGWVARTETGSRLVPVTVNGWQQGWVLPADAAGTITLTFGSNWLYRVGLAGGLALLPLLALLAWWPPRNRRRDRDEEASARPYAPRRWVAAVAGLGVGAVIAGPAGVAVFGAALGLLYCLRYRQRAYAAVTLGLSAGGLIAAGAVLTRHPWRSVDGYAGHSARVQLLALISVAVLAAAGVVRPPRGSGVSSASD